MGKILGLSLVQGVPLGVTLAPSLCKMLLGRKPQFSDLRFVQTGEHDQIARCLDPSLNFAERKKEVQNLKL